MTHAGPDDGGKAPGVSQDARRRVALIANCLLNQNAKVCEGAHYRGVVSPVVQALRSRGYELQQLPCPELAFAGARRWWAVYEQYDTPAYRAHCRRLAQAIAPRIEQHLRRGDEVILIGLDGSPSTGVRFTSSKPDWGGRPNRPDDDWDIVPAPGHMDRGTGGGTRAPRPAAACRPRAGRSTWADSTRRARGATSRNSWTVARPPQAGGRRRGRERRRCTRLAHRARARHASSIRRQRRARRCPTCSASSRPRATACCSFLRRAIRARCSP